jgi:hypothetical protein
MAGSRIRLMPHGKYRILRRRTGKPIRRPWNYFENVLTALAMLTKLRVEGRDD